MPAAATTTTRIRVVVAKPGLDGHDRGGGGTSRAVKREPGVRLTLDVCARRA
jgi:methylmalonyl-CoA mutase cobalamin-binding subunit